LRRCGQSSKNSATNTVEKGTVGLCDLSVLHVGGEWQWLVRRAGRDVVEGAAPGLVEAKQDAETVALALG
jgi:hypothetical protein